MIGTQVLVYLAVGLAGHDRRGLFVAPVVRSMDEAQLAAVCESVVGHQRASLHADDVSAVHSVRAACAPADLGRGYHRMVADVAGGCSPASSCAAIGPSERALWTAKTARRCVRLSARIILTIEHEPDNQARRVRPSATPLPRYQSAHAAGMDLVADIEASLELAPMSAPPLPTGIALEIPPGFEGQVRPRSGRALEEGLTSSIRRARSTPTIAAKLKYCL